jgi:hypothetical protein
MTMKKIIIIFSLSLIFTFSVADTHIPAGNVNGVWTFPNSPYIIDGEISIQQGDELTIEPGIQVIFSGHYKFNIYGRILAEGTAADSIFFTAQNTIEGWNGLRFLNANSNGQDSSRVIYCKLEFGNATTYPQPAGGAIFCHYSSDILIKNCLITNNKADWGGGICCWSNSSPRLENIIISENTATSGGGIEIEADCNPSFQNVTICNNTSQRGGGIYCINAGFYLENVTISKNIANGSGCYYGGGGICSLNSNISLTNVNISENTAYTEGGGGIYIENGNTNLNNVTIYRNISDWSGGGLYCLHADINFENCTITENSAANKGGGICFYEGTLNFDILNRCNIFLNFAGSGNELYSAFPTLTDVIVDTFTVSQPDNYFAYPLDNFTFDILNAKIEQVNQDLYVSSTGSNNNSGLFANDPLLTISYALAKIIPDSTDPHIIYLANGTYSPSQTGEIFQLNCRSYVSILGDTENSTILDAEELTRIIYYENVSYSNLENVTICNGFSNSGGGIYFNNSNPGLDNITISENNAHFVGGGISCIGSNPVLSNIIIKDNIVDQQGGGIYFLDSSPILTNVLINENSANYGGGVYCDNSNPNLSNVTIYENSADIYGGIYFSDSNPIFNPVNRCNIFFNSASIGYLGNDLYANDCLIIDVIVDTFTVLQPYDYYAFPIDNYTFDILHYKIEQVNQDLYVNPNGSNNNSGLTPDDPLLTVSYALTKILPDSTNPKTIYLSNGTFSPSQTGESFPLSCKSYISIIGENEDTTILDGEGMSGILYCYDDNNFFIKNMTIQNGNTNSGGGVYFHNSNPSLENVIISVNTANCGGGIYCWNSSPTLTNVTISGNNADFRGGGIYSYNSFPSLINVTISENNATNCGGGIHSYNGSSLTLLNCILWNDSPQEVNFHSAYSPNTITISYSDIKNGEAGIVTNNNGIVNWLEGNIDEDPLFTDPQNGDFHLTWANFPLPDSTMSPCIDTGNPNFPFDPDGTIADMGAFYFDQNQQEVKDLSILKPITILHQNYPNPFNPTTTISFSVTQTSSFVTLEIYNIKGQKVKTLVNKVLPAGEHSVVWDGKNTNNKTVASGIYFYNLKVGHYKKARKMLLIK